MALKVIRPQGTREEMYAQLDEWLTDILGASEAILSDEVMEMLQVYDRQLRIALGIPVEASN